MKHARNSSWARRSERLSFPLTCLKFLGLGGLSDKKLLLVTEEQ